MDLLLDLAVTIVGFLIVGCYTWSLKGHFSSPKMPDGAKIISAAVTATTLFFTYQVWARHQPALPRMLALCMEIGAAVLFWWAVSASRRAKLRFAFDPDNPDSIVTEGPYRHIRHPFYTSYLIFWAGWALATQSIWALVPVIGFLVIYVAAARDEERKFSNSPLAAAYEAYRRKTGFFFPRIAGN